MDSNQIISKRRGGKYLVLRGFTADGTRTLKCCNCNRNTITKIKSINTCKRGDCTIPNYSIDPAAWTPELYQWIEEKGLWRQYLEALSETLGYELITTRPQPLEIIWDRMWAMEKATPDQKSTALVRAIQESGK